MTATPAATLLWIGTTFFTPLIAIAFLASNLSIAPPSTGERSTTATSIPGTAMSRPNFAFPLTFRGVSSRLVGLPSNLNVLGSLSLTSFGTGSVAAFVASWP